MFFKRNALRTAIESNDVAAVIDLLDRHPELSTRRDARDMLSLALKKADDEIVLALGRAKFNLLLPSTTDNALVEAASHARHVVIKTWLDEFPLLWSAEDRARLLNVAVRKGDNDTLRFLLDNQLADPDALSGYWDKALNIAISHKNAEAVQMLRADLARREELRHSQNIAVPAQPRATAEEWHVVDATTIMRVRDVAPAGYRLTDIFNFAMGTCTSVQRNLDTNVETAVTCDLTAAAARTGAQEAHARLRAAGGTPPALPGAVRINKLTGANDV